MASKMKVLYWLIRDWLVPDQPDAYRMSAQRVNREIIDQMFHGDDEASVKCKASVKRRMLLGSLSPDAPIIGAKGE